MAGRTFVDKLQNSTRGGSTRKETESQRAPPGAAKYARGTWRGAPTSPAPPLFRLTQLPPDDVEHRAASSQPAARRTRPTTLLADSPSLHSRSLCGLPPVLVLALPRLAALSPAYARLARAGLFPPSQHRPASLLSLLLFSVRSVRVQDGLSLGPLADRRRPTVDASYSAAACNLISI